MAAEYVVEWVEETPRRRSWRASSAATTVLLESLNVPVCTDGEIRGEIEVPMSTSSDGAIADQDCTSTLEDPADDIVAFNNGFVTISDVTLRAASLSRSPGSGRPTRGAVRDRRGARG